ncbi:MAG: HU family DNA-binding protein [Candidatus Lambdaproteobacteria bacterium]|nr:HU family DNA-binding protein [Candidatus Lambdaproteobacteria bacterium]
MPAKNPTRSKTSQSDLYSLIAKASGQSEAVVSKVMGAFQSTVLDQTFMGNDVALGIGTFKRADKPARNGRNPSTGEQIKIAASKGVKFQVGAKFKQHLN